MAVRIVPHLQLCAGNVATHAPRGDGLGAARVFDYPGPLAAPGDAATRPLPPAVVRRQVQGGLPRRMARDDRRRTGPDTAPPTSASPSSTSGSPSRSTWRPTRGTTQTPLRQIRQTKAGSSLRPGLRLPSPSPPTCPTSTSRRSASTTPGGDAALSPPSRSSAPSIRTAPNITRPPSPSAPLCSSHAPPLYAVASRWTSREGCLMASRLSCPDRPNHGPVGCDPRSPPGQRIIDPFQVTPEAASLGVLPQSRVAADPTSLTLSEGQPGDSPILLARPAEEAECRPSIDISLRHQVITSTVEQCPEKLDLRLGAPGASRATVPLPEVVPGGGPFGPAGPAEIGDLDLLIGVDEVLGDLVTPGGEYFPNEVCGRDLLVHATGAAVIVREVLPGDLVPKPTLQVPVWDQLAIVGVDKSLRHLVAPTGEVSPDEIGGQSSHDFAPAERVFSNCLIRLRKPANSPDFVRERTRLARLILPLLLPTCSTSSSPTRPDCS